VWHYYAGDPPRLESDPYAAAPDNILDIKVSETWVSGRKTHGSTL
jgi:predicted amidohydrolase YtcJ